MNTHTDIHGPLWMFSFLHDRSALSGPLSQRKGLSFSSAWNPLSSFSSNHPWMQTLICPWFWLLMVSPGDKAWFFHSFFCGDLGFPCGSADKESTRNAGNLGLIPGLGWCPGLENSMDCIVCGVTKNRTRLSLSLCGNLSIIYCVPGTVICSLYPLSFFFFLIYDFIYPWLC